MMDLRARLREGEVLCGDGAWGTMLMARGLGPGESPETMNLSHPEVLAEIAQRYIAAGAQLVTTNTFGGSPLKLASSGLEGRTEEVNAAAVAAIRPVADERAYVSASVGPTGALLAPYGETAPEEVRAAFERQIRALVGAGADVICIETMIDLAEARLAIEAARSASADIPIIATMTFERIPRGFFTIMGVSVAEACAGLEEAGADVVGSNCGNGTDAMVEVAAELVAHTSLPVIIQPNAGLPEIREGEVVYPETPAFMAQRVGRLLDLGVGIIGGCCGTGPEHVRTMRAAIDDYRGS